MLPPANVSGHACVLRLGEIKDAKFLYGLRVDPELSRYLSPVTGGVEGQAAWIASYKAREALGSEAYYIVEAPGGRPCGTVRLYDIVAENFTWGSFILTPDKPAKAALDVMLHSLEIGFAAFGCDRAELDAKMENTQALSLYDRFGMARYGEEDGSVLKCYQRLDFNAECELLLEIVKHAHI